MQREWDASAVDPKECDRCRFAGEQKFGRKVCFITGDQCAKEINQPPPVSLSPTAQQALMLWRSIQTQWVIGMDGASGLNYEGVHKVAQLGGFALDEHIFRLIQRVELERLLQIRTARDEKAKAGG